MKKQFFSLLLTLLLLALWPAAALAENADASAQPEVFPYVLDNAGLLSDSQREALEQKAAALSEQHGCSLYIVTVQDHTQFDPDAYEAAKGIFSYYKLGCGDGQDGVLLLLSMGARDYGLVGHGAKGETICGYESSWLIEDEFLDNFGRNDWVGGFSDYLDACGRQLTKLENGEDVAQGAEIITGPDGMEYHSYNAPGVSPGLPTPAKLAIVIFVPLLVALIVCSVFKAQMKNAREKTQADEYIVPRSMNLTVRDDIFTHRTESRTRIETDSGHRGGGGGGSSFHSGGGFSGRSGKF